MKRLCLSNMLIAVLILLTFSASARAECYGKFPNLVTDVCWKCFFPITIGGFKVAGFGQEDFDSGVSSNPVCFCGILPGIRVSFWEPVRVIEVVKQPYCSPFLGGIELFHGTRRGTRQNIGNPALDKAFYNVHYIYFPLAFVMDLVTNVLGCFEVGGFDYAYLTELDPTWADDELAFILNPEAVLFANPVAQVACAPDCITAAAGFPLDPLFWCAGCWGSIYPFSGNTGATPSPVQTSLLMATRMLAKLHREFAANMTIGSATECASFPTGLIVKRQYKLQMFYPYAQTTGCTPIGRAQAIFGDWRTIPVTGEDYVYLVWRKRNCCLSLPI